MLYLSELKEHSAFDRCIFTTLRRRVDNTKLGCWLRSWEGQCFKSLYVKKIAQMFCCTPSFYRPITGCTSNYAACFENVDNKHSRTPLIRTLVIPIANFPDRLGPSGKFIENSIKLICLEITSCRINYRTVLWLLELLIRHGRKI
jgi:hypothetical protein